MSTYLNDLMNVERPENPDNYNLARIDMSHLKAIWGKCIQNNTGREDDDQAYLGSYCKYDDDALNDIHVCGQF